MRAPSFIHLLTVGFCVPVWSAARGRVQQVHIIVLFLRQAPSTDDKLHNKWLGYFVRWPASAILDASIRHSFPTTCIIIDTVVVTVLLYITEE